MLYYTKIRAAWFAQKGGCCIKCGSTEHLHADHIKRADKRGDPFRMPKAKRERELRKCQVLCRDCHRKKSADERRLSDFHGTRTGYTRYACRCPDCKAANARDHRLVLERKKTRVTPFDKITHGTATGYKYHRCRCPECRAFAARETAAKLKRARQTPFEQKPHGTITGASVYGCHCLACRDALNAYRRARRATLRANKHRPQRKLSDGRNYYVTVGNPSIGYEDSTKT